MRKIGGGGPGALSRKLFSATFAVGAATIVVFIAARCCIATGVNERRLRDSLADCIAVHAAPLRKALDKSDAGLVAAILQGMESSSSISFAAIVEGDRSVISSGTRTIGSGYEQSVELVEGSGPAAGTMLVLQGDEGMIRRETFASLAGELPPMIAAVAFIALFLTFYIDRTVTRRLAADAAEPRSVPFRSFPGQGKRTASEVPDISVPDESLDEYGTRVRLPKAATVANEEQYRVLFENSPVPILIADFSDAVREAVELLGSTPAVNAGRAGVVRLLEANEAALAFIGTSDLAGLSEKRNEIFGKITGAFWSEILEAMIEGSMRGRQYGTLRTVAGEEKRISLYWESLPADGADFMRVILVLIDVTERERAREKLAANLKEKETLIRELFHRTMNNMQSIIGLLSFESWKVEDEAIRSILKSLEDRVYSMALVHRMLFEYQDLSRLSLTAYLRELLAWLDASNDVKARNINFDLRLEEIEASIDIAVPVGLIIAELVDNALTHAFLPGSGGTIRIDLARLDEHNVALSVSDDGKGVRRGFEPTKDGILGMNLITSLAESQLGGEAVFESPEAGGFSCRVTLKPDFYVSRI